MNHNNKLPDSLNEFQDIWNLSKNYSPKEAQSNDESWAKLQEKLAKPHSNYSTSSPKSTLKISYVKWISVAAAITIFAISGLLFFNQKQQIISGVFTTKNEIKSFQLSDGSTVVLAANSSVHFSFSNNKREIQLSGKARFEVAKDSTKPFSVVFNSNKITVLGTGFDINAYNKNKQYVFVNHGKVKLESESEELILTKNLGANIQLGKITGYSAPQNPVDWNKNNLRFSNANLELVLSTLSETFQKEFFCASADSNLKFSGSFDLSQNPTEIALIISKALNTTVSVK